MKQLPILLILLVLIASCDVANRVGQSPGHEVPQSDPLIEESLFQDKASTIPEENIQKILNGTYKLPHMLRVSIVRIDGGNQRRRYWDDEDYLKMQQTYMDVFSEKLQLTSRVGKISVIPDLLVSRPPTFTNIREAAVRMQSDIVVIYSITSDIYSKYKFLSRSDFKAFATTQLLIMDVKTGLVPFSAVVTKDYLSQKKKEELTEQEARRRVQHEAVLLTIFEIGNRINDFLKAK